MSTRSVLMSTLCALSLASSSNIFAQETTKKVSAGSESSGAVEVRFFDGGNLRMTIAEEYLELNTAHGKLKIAVADIRRMELATRISDAIRRLIDQSIVDLGSPQFRLREKASAELLALRERSYPDVLKATRSPDAETAKRAQDIAEKIRAKVPAARLRFREKDVIFTSDSTISGRIELASFNATTTQFGQVQLKLADVLSMHFLAGGAETHLKL